MKKIVPLIIIMIFVLGCIGEKQETPEKPQTPEKPPLPPNGTPSQTTPTVPPTTSTPTTTSPPVLGKILNPVFRDKMWSEYRYNGEENEIIWKFFDDGDTYIFEYEIRIRMEEENSIVQVWYKRVENPQETEPIKYVMKMEGVVFCRSVTTFSNPAENYTPEKYENYKIIREDKYTTPTGKTVKVLIVSDGKTELWFSDEVPFSIVKVIDEDTSIILEDFGFDAKRKISREEGENCISM